jgi:hypothetical protein
MELETGRIYTAEERENMTLVNWMSEDGEVGGYDGANVADYFDANGRYLGPDQDGVYPEIEIYA